MDWIKDREKRILSDWAARNGALFSFALKESPSTCFENFDNTGNIEEYQFSNINELDTMFRNCFGEVISDDIIKCCSVAVFKRNPMSKMKSDDSSHSEMEIPDFVYVF